jgi:uncharacterized SAM-binding protein YcdF (DUF218 family)
MLFFLRKLIEAALMPLGFFGLIALAGAVFRRRWLVFSAIGGLIALSTPFASRLLMSPLESVWPSASIEAAPVADAAVVLSGGILRGLAGPGIQWGDDSNRFFSGLDLALAGKVKLLVLSAGAPPSHQGVTQGTLLRQASIARGFPADRIVVTRYSLTTEEEARAVSELPGIHSILLVTSAYHMPRAALLFQARNLDVLPFPTDQRVLGPVRLSPFSLIPDSPSLRESEAALREYSGLAVYRTLLFLRPSALKK